MTANISQEVEKAAIRFNTTIEAIAMKSGGFLPMRSASWPQNKFPRSTPAIWIEVIV